MVVARSHAIRQKPSPSSPGRQTAKRSGPARRARAAALAVRDDDPGHDAFKNHKTTLQRAKLVRAFPFLRDLVLSERSMTSVETIYFLMIDCPQERPETVSALKWELNTLAHMCSCRDDVIALRGMLMRQNERKF